MKLLTYHTFRNAFLGVNHPVAYSHIVSLEKDPYLIRQAKFLFSNRLYEPLAWDVENYTGRFRNVPAKQRLEDTVMTFLLHSVIVIKEDIFRRTFSKPGTHDTVQGWIMLFKQCFETLTTLLFKVKWTAHNYRELDGLILSLIHQGQCKTLRQFMTEELHIDMVTHITQAEIHFERLGELNIAQLGSSVWRLLHWVAESMDRSDRDEEAKESWRTLLSSSLYRFLVCGICRTHMHNIVTELKEQLASATISNRELWFNIHNKVNGIIQKPKPTYSESELKADVEFMLQALEE